MLKITIIAIGNKMPNWVIQAEHEYRKRLQDKMMLSMIEIPLQPRSKTTDLARIMEKEMAMMTAAMPANSYKIGLVIKGQLFTSEQLANKLSQLKHITSHVCFLIGGPEGLSPELVKTCHETWSLSNLTFSHILARIVLLESLYRSWAISENHPYHK